MRSWSGSQSGCATLPGAGGLWARWLSDEEWTKLLAAAERPLWDQNLPERSRVRALFHRAVLLVYGGAGLRLSEGCALRREDVDPAGYIRALGKGGEENIVPVEDAVVDVIREWVAAQDSTWVFHGRGGGQLQPRSMQVTVRGLRRGCASRSGLPSGYP